MTTPAPQSTPGNMATFNILHGFPEALVRGMRSSFLADSDYHHLTQCENLDDFRLNLSETDYSEGIQDNSALTPTSLQSAAVEKVSSSPFSGRAPPWFSDGVGFLPCDFFGIQFSKVNDDAGVEGNCRPWILSGER